MKTLKKYKNIFKLKQPCSLLPKPMALMALAGDIGGDLARHHGQSVARFCPWNTKIGSRYEEF